MGTAHSCYCRNCRPDKFPTRPKEGPNHIAIRFGDRWWQATLNGQPVKHLTEALAGEHGYVVHYPEADFGEGYGRHICAVCLPASWGLPGKARPNYGACERVDYGRVEIAPIERKVEAF